MLEVKTKDKVDHALWNRHVKKNPLSVRFVWHKDVGKSQNKVQANKLMHSMALYAGEMIQTMQKAHREDSEKMLEKAKERNNVEHPTDDVVDSAGSDQPEVSGTI